MTRSLLSFLKDATNASSIMNANLMGQYQNNYIWGKHSAEIYNKSMVLSSDFLQTLTSIRLAVVIATKHSEAFDDSIIDIFKIPIQFLKHNHSSLFTTKYSTLINIFLRKYNIC